jgi:acyl carrier protein
VAGTLRLVDRLPRTAGGEVDFAALLCHATGSTRPERVPPRDELERRIAAIWRAYLPVEEVGALDSFFDLGGHSMMLAQVHARMERELGRSLSVLELFRYPTVRALASFLTGSGPERPGTDDVQARAQRQQQARGRHRSRRAAANPGKDVDE